MFYDGIHVNIYVIKGFVVNYHLLSCCKNGKSHATVFSVVNGFAKTLKAAMSV